MADSDRLSIVPALSQAAWFPYERSNPHASPWEVLPLPAEPWGWGLPFPSDASKSTVTNLTPEQLNQFEGITFTDSRSGSAETVVMKIDPFYHYEDIDDDYARALTKMKSILCKIFYFPILNISPNGTTAANFDIDFILPKDVVVASIQAGGSDVNAS